jgi:hypothetical protein
MSKNLVELKPSKKECLDFWDNADNSVRVDLLCMNPVGCEHYSMIDKIRRYLRRTP